MRPSRFLGYDHDSLGIHLTTIGSLDLAESELRRAVWLNPFEQRFMKHLAWCLYKKGSYGEARDWIHRALALRVGDGESQKILSLIEAKVKALCYPSFSVGPKQ
jgi:Flp pilus assembly protein TadD